MNEEIVQKLIELLGEDRFSELADSIEESVSEFCVALIYEVSPRTPLDQVEDYLLKYFESVLRRNLIGIMADFLAD